MPTPPLSPSLRTLSAFCFLLIAAAGCPGTKTPEGSGGAGDDSNTGGDDAANDGADEGGNTGDGDLCNFYAGGSAEFFEVTEDQNYRFSSTLSMQAQVVKPNTSLTFDWSQLTTDITQHSVDPGPDINLVELILWNLSEDELMRKLNNDELAQRDLEALVMVYPDGSTTSAELLDFTSFMTPVDPDLLLSYFDPNTFDPATHSYTMLAASGDTAGEGTKMLALFRLDDAADSTEVVLDSNSTQLDFTVDLRSLTPIEIAPGSTDVEFSWKKIETTAMGTEFIANSITNVRVAHYEESPEDLEREFLFLEDIADQVYLGEIKQGNSVTLDQLVDADGKTFGGIDGEGTWILALECGRCANPAPWFISLLRPCGSAR